MRMLIGLVYSGILAIWVFMGLVGLHLGLKNLKKWPRYQRSAFGLRGVILGHLTEALFTLAMFGITALAVFGVYETFKAVLAL